MVDMAKPSIWSIEATCPRTVARQDPCSVRRSQSHLILFWEVAAPRIRAREFLTVDLSKRSLATSFQAEQEVVEHDCGYCLAPGEKRCCEFQEEGSCQTCCAEHYTEPYCMLNCQKMCRRGMFKAFSGGKRNVPVCPSSGPVKALEAYDLEKVDGKFLNPYLDWKGPKFEKEWLETHPLELPAPTTSEQ
ncbi:unnamed protein product [Durusdinium trenchii]|uniref:Uncharacterized protein n=1 Tax=Durusdinium trenchii TaxID=1381693 RepID=A0ABP0RK85_9DINO